MIKWSWLRKDEPPRVEHIEFAPWPTFYCCACGGEHSMRSGIAAYGAYLGLETYPCPEIEHFEGAGL